MVVFMMMCVVYCMIVVFLIIGMLDVWVLMAIMFIFYCNVIRLIRFLVLFLF